METWITPLLLPTLLVKHIIPGSRLIVITHIVSLQNVRWFHTLPLPRKIGHRHSTKVHYSPLDRYAIASRWYKLEVRLFHGARYASAETDLATPGICVEDLPIDGNSACVPDFTYVSARMYWRSYNGVFIRYWREVVQAFSVNEISRAVASDLKMLNCTFISGKQLHWLVLYWFKRTVCLSLVDCLYTGIVFWRDELSSVQV